MTLTVKRAFARRKGPARAIACILFLAPCLVVLGQQDSSSGTADRARVYSSNTTISVHSDLVLIPVTVTDGSGKVVSGLEKEHFTLFEDDAEQKITHFAAEDAPASIGIVFDASDSMLPKMRKAREAVNALLNNANPQDEFFLVRFSSEARVVIPMTSRPEEIREAMEMMRISGSTSLLDGVHVGMREMTHARYTRKAIIIISDGEDNSSRWTVNELLSAVQEGDVLIYAIGITDGVDMGMSWPPPPRLTGPALLSKIAKQTGGRLFEVTKLKQLPDVAAKIGGWLRNQYVLGYVPGNANKDGRYRSVQVKIVRPQGFPKLHAIWRLGYYPPKE